MATKPKTRFRAPSSARVILTRALRYIQGGWIQGTYSRGRYYCLSGAINKATTGRHAVVPHSVSLTQRYDVARRALLDAIVSRRGVACSIVSYNDYIAQRKADVLAVLRDAIKSLSATKKRGTQTI